MRVVRAQLDSGQRIIGVRYPQVLITLAEKTVIQETTFNRTVQSNEVCFYMILFQMRLLFHKMCILLL